MTSRKQQSVRRKGSYTFFVAESAVEVAELYFSAVQILKWFQSLKANVYSLDAELQCAAGICHWCLTESSLQV